MPVILADQGRSEIDNHRLAQIVDEAMAAAEPSAALKLNFFALLAEGNHALIAAVFESVLWRIEILDPFVLYPVATAYQAMDCDLGAQIAASAALRIDRSFAGAPAMHRILFDYYGKRGRTQDASAVLAAQHALVPLHPLAVVAPAVEAASPDADTTARIDAIVDDIVTSAGPEATLLRHLQSFDEANEPAHSCHVFESVAWRVNLGSYWTFYRAFTCYRTTGKRHASFLTAALADRIGPTFSGAYGVGREMFLYFNEAGRHRDAVDVFVSHAGRFPGKPIAALWEVRSAFASAGVPLSEIVGGAQGASSGEPIRSSVRVVEEEIRQPLICAMYGATSFKPLDYFRESGIRPAIDVACLHDAEVLIDLGSFVVIDAHGAVQPDLSVHDFPVLLRKHFDASASAGRTIEHIEVDEAIITGDRFPGPPNLCHHILDHFTRLELYRRAGVDVAAVTVIGSEATAPFQKLLLERAGVGSYVHTGQVARVKVKKLWVSSNCRNLQHPAHGGAAWAIEYVRNTLLAGDTKPTRKLYVSRQDATGRRVTNEAEIMELLGSNGFELIVPGRLPFEAQIAAFADASHIVGPHGAGLTNIVVSKPGMKMLELFHPLYGTGAYAALSVEGGFDYAALIGRDGHSDVAALNDPAAVDLARNVWGGRDIKVDMRLLASWLDKA